MDQHELAQELYHDNRILYGDGDYAWNVSWDEAGEIIRGVYARQVDWEDALVDYWADGETPTVERGSTPRRDKPIPAGEQIIRGAINTASAALIGELTVRGVDWLINCIRDWLKSNGTSGSSVAPSVSERLDRLESQMSDIRSDLDETKAILARLEMPQVA